MKALRGIVVAGIVLGTSVVATPPALAHDVTRKYRWGGPTGPTVARVRIDHGHKKLEVCDLKADGRGVSAQYQMRNGAYGTLGDGNGSKGGCGNRWTSSPIKRWRVKIGGHTFGWANA